MSSIDVRETMINTGSATIHVTDSGTGAPALVFLHYWGGSSRTWRLVIDRLANSARCVAIDHRGWGRSSAPADGYAMEDLAGDVGVVIDALDLSEYILIGHSMGGKVAQLLATRRPPGLRGLVLVAPAPARPAAVPEEALAQMRRAYVTRESVLATLDGVLRHASLSHELREQIAQDSLAGAGAAKSAWPTSGIAQDVSADLARIDVPVLVVAGREDQVEPVAILQSHVLDAIPGARLEIVENSGHLIPLEQPDALADLIATFVRTRGPQANAANRNIQIVRDLIEQFFNAHDPEAADRFLTEDFWWTGGSVGTTEGRDAYKQVMPGFWAGLPDAHATEDEILDAGEAVIARFTVTGTHQGQLWGIAPTGRHVSWQAVMIYKFRDGKIAQQWAAEDWTAILSQIGDITPPWDRTDA